MTSRIRSERGAAIVETALTLPVLLLVAVAIFEFGRAYQTWQVLTNAAREGARVAVLQDTSSGDVDTRVKDYLTVGQLPNAASTDVVVDRNAVLTIGTGTATGSQVTVNYPFEFMVLQPVAQLVVSGSTVGPPFTMIASAEMRNESQ